MQQPFSGVRAGICFIWRITHARISINVFQRLSEEKINLFYVKTPIQFGMANEL